MKYPRFVLTTDHLGAIDALLCNPKAELMVDEDFREDLMVAHAKIRVEIERRETRRDPNWQWGAND